MFLSRFHQHSYYRGFLVGAITFISLAGIAAIIVHENRAAIFNYFASDFVQESRRGDDGENESFDETRALVTQESLIVDIAERASKSVFSIVITKDVPIVEQYFERDPFSDFFGGDFFNFGIPRYRERGTEERQVGSGSGFVIGEDGLAVTNRHVVFDDSASYTAFTSDGAKHNITVVAKDPVLDIAIIRLSGNNFLPLPFGDSDQIKVGQSVIAIGNALGEFRNSVSVGIVSGLSRSIVAGDETGGSEFLDEVIQTDAAINPGNSGGPLLDLRGKVIGMNVAVARGSENIAFSLPSNLVKNVINSINDEGKIVRPFLGVRYLMVTPAIAERNRLSVDYGALVVNGDERDELAVVPGSPADRAGIAPNDIILEVDGKKLGEGTNLATLIRRRKVGDVLSLTILHRGEEKKISVTLDALPE